MNLKSVMTLEKAIFFLSWFVSRSALHTATLISKCRSKTILFQVAVIWKLIFLTFPACFLIPIFFSNLNSNCSNLLDMRNLQEEVKKGFFYQNLPWPFTVWINCSCRLAASNFRKFCWSLEQFSSSVHIEFKFDCCEKKIVKLQVCIFANSSNFTWFQFFRQQIVKCNEKLKKLTAYLLT